ILRNIKLCPKLARGALRSSQILTKQNFRPALKSLGNVRHHRHRRPPHLVPQTKVSRERSVRRSRVHPASQLARRLPSLNLLKFPNRSHKKPPDQRRLPTLKTLRTFKTFKCSHALFH